MKVLLVEDDAKIRDFLSKGLSQEGFVVDAVDRAEHGLAACLGQASGGAASESYDAAIVDLMLPGMDGLTLIERLRGQGVRMPILILSARRSVDDRVKGFQRGGDDYLVKPFSFAELVARLHALIRRSAPPDAAQQLVAADLCVYPQTREVYRGDSRIELGPREFTLLEYLLRNKGRVLSKTMIMERVWNYDFDPQTNVVDVLVSRLRSRIDRDFEPKLIHTIRGVGYVLKEDTV